MRNQKMITKVICLFALLASANVFAEIKAERASETVTRSEQRLDGSFRFTKRLDSKVYDIVRGQKLVPKLISVPTLVCPEGSANGSDGDWKGFFSASRSQKAKKLAAAIKGVGPVTSKDLVSHFYKKPPRSWSEFARVIRRADDEIGKGLAHKVLVQYADDNMRNLGYLSTGSTCYVSHKMELTAILVDYIVRKDYLKTETRHFDVTIENALLLPGESESFTVSFEDFKGRISKSSNYNRYREVENEVSGNTQTIILSGTRIKRNPQNYLSVIARNDNGEMVLTVINSKAQVDEEIGGTAIINITIKRSAWGPDRTEKSEYQEQLELGVESQVIRTGFMLPKRGKEYYAEYSIERIGTQFYTSRASSEKETGMVTK